MKKFLSIFVALAMVLSLFAGVGARTAKAATDVTSSAFTMLTANNTVTVTLTGGTFKAGAIAATDFTFGGTDATALGAGTSFVRTSDTVVTFMVATGLVGTDDTVLVKAATQATQASSVAAVATTIVPTLLTITDPTLTLSKVVNGTDTTAAVTAGTLIGVVSPDVVTVTAVANYTSNGTGSTFYGVGTGKQITVVYTLAGANAAKYTKPVNYVVATGVITASPATLTISNPTLTLSKVYDGNTTAVVTPGTLAGVVSPDVVTVTAVATYDTAAVGATKTITVVYTLGGANAANYIKPVDYTVATGAITALPLPAGTVALTVAPVSGTTNVLLSWTYSAADATAFAIYRNGTVIGYVAAATMTYTDAATVAGQYYTYYVTPMINGLAGTPSFSKSILVAAAVPGAPAATSTLTLTPSGNFAGGVDGTSTTSTNAVGTVGIDGSVTVTTAGVGVYHGSMSVSTVATGVLSTDPNWDLTGYQWVTLADTVALPALFVAGTKIAVAGTSTNGIGTIIAVGTASAAITATATDAYYATGTIYNTFEVYVNISTAVVGVIGKTVYTVATVKPAFSTNWLTLGTYPDMGFPVSAGQLITVNMDATDEGQYATAFLIVSGIPVKGDIATVTWQDTLAASHTVSYTTIANDDAGDVAAALASLINNLDATTGNVTAELASPTVIQLIQDVAGVAGNGKTLTATTTAAVTPTLTIHTLGGLTSPAYVELGKTIQLVAVDATGATVTAPFALTSGTSATVSATGLVTAAPVASNLTGVSVITATSGTATGVFAVIVVPVQIITSLTINLVPALPVSITKQQFGAIASNAAYSALDYTTQAVWTDALPVASIAAVNGLLTYSTDETGNVYASAGGITATANIKIATGVVTLVPVVGPVTKVIVLTIGSDIVTIDDKATTVDAAPEIVDGRTFVPIRFIAETFGSTVTWLPETKGITIVLGDTTIGLQIGNATAVINGTIIALEAAPYIKNSRTMVPLRVISESFGGNVAWDPINHIITITYVLPVVLPAA